MNDSKRGFTRREFMELSAMGVAGAAIMASGLPSVFAAAPRRGGKVNCGMSFLIQNPDPQRRTGTWARQCSAMAYEGLTTPTSLAERLRIIKEKGVEAVPDVQPMLAESWDIEKNGQRIVYHLKKGVKFHNGKEFDSGDVKWSWERIQDTVHQCAARKLLTQYLESIDTPDRHTIVANLSQLYPAFLIASAWCNSPVLPKDCMPYGAIWGEVIPKDSNWKEPTAAPPGTGPFELVEFQQKHEAVFKAHKEYYGRDAAGNRLPYLDEVVFKVISQDVARTMALRAGDVNYIYSVESGYMDEVMKGKDPMEYYGRLVEHDGLQVVPQFNEATLTIFLNNHPTKGNSPFHDLRVRQALELCIDRKQLANVLYGKFGYPMGQGYPHQISPWGFKDITYRSPDIEKAKQLMKEAGYAQGVDVDFYVTPTWGKNDLMAQVVQQMASQAGFRIKIHQEVGMQYWARLRPLNYQMFVYTIAGDDPMDFYYRALHTDPEPPNDGYSTMLGVKDPVLDELLDAQAVEMDLQKRRAIFKKVVEHSNEMSYWVPYLRVLSSNGWSRKLKNLNINNYFYPEQAFREAWLES